MGKPTGFMEYERSVNPAIAPGERVKNFNEFHPPMDEDARRQQGARCMNCGVPFCQSAVKIKGMVSGCPLHNLIPEWNDEIYNGNWELALARLRKTSNFPEFTGRVCPALCEVACTCGLNGNPVTCKENELAIIEHGYANGLIKPHLPAVRTDKRIAVIGSGPSGLAVADQLNQRGHNVTVYEREDRAGGLLMYGIPNMKLEKTVIERKLALMQEEGVTFVTNADVGNNIAAEEILDNYDAVVLCCGAKQARDLNVPGREGSDVYFAVDFLTSTTKSLLDFGLADGTYVSAKGKNVVIVGGGDTGNDCVGTSIRHGCLSVTQLEMMPKAPDSRLPGNPWPEWPKVCKTDYGQEEAIALFGHDPRIYQTTVKQMNRDADGKLVSIDIVSLKSERDEQTGRMRMVEVPGSEKNMPCELLLIAAGFTGCQSYVAEAFGVECTQRSVIATEAERYQTNQPKVFTAGDVHRGQSLVVWAIAEGRACAREVDEYLMGYTNMI